MKGNQRSLTVQHQQPTISLVCQDPNRFLLTGCLDIFSCPHILSVSLPALPCEPLSSFAHTDKKHTFTLYKMTWTHFGIMHVTYCAFKYQLLHWLLQSHVSCTASSCEENRCLMTCCVSFQPFPEKSQRRLMPNKKKTSIKVTLKQAYYYFQSFFFFPHVYLSKLVVQRVSAWPSSGSICAYPCGVITPPILINDTTTTHWLYFAVSKCSP